MIYAVDIRKILTRQLPRRKRLPKRIAWIYALLFPAKEWHDEFVALMDEYKYTMKWNAQRILLQRVLQLRFGNGILIENQDPNTLLIGYVIDDARNSLAGLAPGFGNPIGAEAGAGIFANPGFIVQVPAIIVFDENEMKAVINLYNQQSTYQIVII